MPEDRIHSWHLFPIRLRLDRLSISRNTFIDELRERGVACSVHWRPLHLHPYYAETFGWRPEDLPAATAVWERLISLPIFPGMREEEIAARGRDTSAPSARTTGGALSTSRPRLGAGLPRPVEAALALGGLVAAAPVIGLCALAVLVTSGSPAFFRQTRVGRGGPALPARQAALDASVGAAGHASRPAATTA